MWSTARKLFIKGKRILNNKQLEDKELININSWVKKHENRWRIMREVDFEDLENAVKEPPFLRVNEI